ncbi:EmrB/QacA subfamily drug resistance transporter [Salinibacterium amurskyense]|uniref:EmrB/QacA subfamily drug resistance transporter n=1 Tax=Salinibacterium amurskyense TaxID=205941 RepID=A0A2M9D2Z8_9MICO|nr:MDR family MFS transporter [Salinibacterium amurskyense]PJJ78388.1 EmrB/QacA subfamily drug resistance transporter [Salinibacterium amurskyense]GHD83330.1 MFS transporter [Salinibacterium amurskyense]
MTAPARATTPSPDHSGAPVTYTHREILQVMTGLLAALFTAMISTTIVSTALPTIIAELDGTQRQYTWVITSSLLAMTITTPIWGKLSDLYDKKLLTQLSIIFFLVGSIAAGFAGSIGVLMIARALQGIAMGGLTALVQSIMGSIIAPRERGRYAGYMGAVMAVATVSGPLLGGVITDSLGWRWCFFVSLPLAVIALIVLQLKLHLPATVRRQTRLDYLGALLVSITAALPMLWVTFAGNDYDWISWQSGVFLAAFLVVGLFAVIVELRAPTPMIPLRLLGNSTTIWMIVASVGIGVGMFGSGILLTQYFQLGTGASPTQAGLMTIPMIISQLLSATIGGLIVSRIGRWKPVMLVGSVLLLAGLTGLGTITHDTAYWTVAIYMVLMGVGIGALVQNVVLAVQNTVDVKDVGSASAAIAFFRSLGGAVGVTVLGAVLTNHVSTNIVDDLAEIGVDPSALSNGSGETSLDITGLPEAIQTAFHHAYADAFGSVFMIAALVTATAVIAIAVARGSVLRTTIGMAPPAGVTTDKADDADKPGKTDTADTATDEPADENKD